VTNCAYIAPSGLVRTAADFLSPAGVSKDLLIHTGEPNDKTLQQQ
jgi:hypothetical protein